jgi:hypothetical protein
LLLRFKYICSSLFCISTDVKNIQFGSETKEF